MCKLWLQIKHTPYKRDIIRSFNIKLRSSYNLLRCNVKHRYKKFTTVIAKLDVFNVCKLASLISPRVIHVIIYIQGVLAIKYPCAHARVYICTCIIFQFSNQISLYQIRRLTLGISMRVTMNWEETECKLWRIRKYFFFNLNFEKIWQF